MGQLSLYNFCYRKKNCIQIQVLTRQKKPVLHFRNGINHNSYLEG
jgi:hypothetical protein